MHSLRKILVLMLLAPAFAGAVSPDQAAMLIARQNPAVEATRASYAEQLEGARAANVLAGPEIEGAYNFATKGGRAEDRWEVSVGQTFEWPGVYSARREANRYRADAFAMLYRQALADAAQEAHTTLIDFMAAREKVELLHLAVAAIENLHDALEKAYSDGNVTALDLKKVHMERFAMQSNLARAESTVATLEARLLAMGASTDMLADLGTLSAGTAPAPIQHYRDAFAANDPAIAASQSMAHALQADAKVAARSVLPSFTLSYSHSFEDDNHFNGIGLAIALPSWSNTAARRAARAAVEAAGLQTKDYSLRVMAELTAKHTTADKLAARLNQGRCAFEGESYSDMLDKALANGAITLLEYFTEYNSYLNAAADYIDLKAEYAAAMAFLNRYTNPVE